MDSLEDTRIIPDWARREGISRCFLYNGPSMKPLFKEGDLLFVRAVSFFKVKRGDVVVFKGNLDSHKTTVHRVIKVSKGGLVTRGDANRYNDRRPVLPEDLIGRVDILERNGNFYKVYNGTPGYVVGMIFRIIYSSYRLLRKLFGFPYRILRDSKVVRRLIARFFSPKFDRILIQTPQGLLVKFIYKGKVVATFLPGKDRFRCVKPFDFFLRKEEEKRWVDNLTGRNIDL